MNKMFSRILPKGSVLVFSLIILSIMLVTSLTLLASSALNQKAALSTGSSTRSLQVADAGIEQVLYQIYRKRHATVGDLAAELGADCSGGEVADEDAGWSVRMYDLDGFAMDDCGATDWRERVAAIKSEGTAQGTIRAVEVAVAAEGTAGITGGCAVDGGSMTIQSDSSWGNGCRSEGNGVSGSDGFQACDDASETGYSCNMTSVDGDIAFCSCVED